MSLAMNPRSALLDGLRTAPQQQQQPNPAYQNGVYNQPGGNTDDLAARMAGMGFGQPGHVGMQAQRGQRPPLQQQQQQAALYAPAQIYQQQPSLPNPSLANVPQQHAQVMAYNALNQKVTQAQHLARLNGWSLDEAVARLGGFTSEEIRMLQAAAVANNGMNSPQQQQQMAAAAAAEQVRQLQVLQAQLQARQAQNQQLQAQMLQQQQYQQAQGGYTSPTLPSQASDGSPPRGNVASAYEQRQAAKQQIEANLRARSNGGASFDLQQHGPLVPVPTYAVPNQSLPSPPITSTSQAETVSSKPSLLPTSTGLAKNETASNWRKGPAPANTASSDASSRSSPVPSIRGQSERRSPPLPSGRQSSPDRTNTIVPSRSGRTSPRGTLPSAQSRYTPEPSYSGQQTPTFAVVVIRQPRGPPAGADELGGHNFASRIRQKAALDMSNVLGRRAELTTGA